MKKHSKRYRAAAEKIEAEKQYALGDAIGLLKQIASAKSDETVTFAFRLGVDARKENEQVRGSVVLPNGTGKTVRILAFAKGEKANEAKAAGADIIADDETVKKIQEGWLEFDAVVADPTAMAQVGKLGKILGPRGLMPSPKTGTVTANLKEAIDRLRAGQVSFRTDRDNNVHVTFGKASFAQEKLLQNAEAVARGVIAAKPRDIGGRVQYLRSVSVAPAHGPSIKIDPAALWDALV